MADYSILNEQDVLDLIGGFITVKNLWELLICDQSVVSHKSSANKDRFSHINSEETIENEPYPKFILG